jgi:hypothetical protein
MCRSASVIIAVPGISMLLSYDAWLRSADVQHHCKPSRCPLRGTRRLIEREREVVAESVHFSDDSMTVHLDDGRALSILLAWYPRLMHAAPQERKRFELIGDGEGIHWPELDEDISVEGLLAGRRSAESDASLARWLEERKE